jgi:hypothetical protein
MPESSFIRRERFDVLMPVLGLFPKLRVVMCELPIRYRALNWGCHLGISRQARGFHLIWLRHERQKQDNVRSDQARLLTRKKREESAYAMLILSGHDPSKSDAVIQTGMEYKVTGVLGLPNSVSTTI